MASARFQLYRFPTGEVMWRFMASNNRELARAAASAADDGVVRDLLSELKRQLMTEARSASYLDRSGRWRWDVRLAGVPVALCSRPYFRRVECEATRTQFLIAVPDAPVSAAVAGYRGHDEQIVLPGPRRPNSGRTGRPQLFPHGHVIGRTPAVSPQAH